MKFNELHKDKKIIVFCHSWIQLVSTLIAHKLINMNIYFLMEHVLLNQLDSGIGKIN